VIRFYILASVPLGSGENDLRLGNRVVFFTPDSSPKKGTVRWLGRIEKILCAGLECVCTSEKGVSIIYSARNKRNPACILYTL
jgi:hypothetical protein